MKTFTNLAHRAFKKCASLGTTNRNRYYLFSIIMLLTLGVGNAWAENVTVTKTTNTLVSELNWSVSSNNTCAGCYTEFQLDEAITISTTGTPNCGSIWGTSTYDWRLYQLQSGNVIVSAKEGYELVSIKFTYGINNSGTLKDGSTNISTNTVVDCSGLKTKTLTVGNTSTKTNGQVRITTFSVTYVQTAGSGSSPVTPTKLTTPTNLKEASIAETSATLSWDAVANASNYSVTINGNTETVTTNSYSATGLTAGTEYTWSVVAKGDGTNYTDSDAAQHTFTTTATTPDPEPGTGTSGEVTFVFDTDQGLSELGIAKPNAGAGTNLGSNVYTKAPINMTATDGGTATRVWNSAGATTLRVYKSTGSLTFSSEATINKIVFNTSITATASVGTLSGTTWTGEAKEVKFTFTANATIKTINVAYTIPSSGGGSEEPTLSATPTEIDFGTVYQGTTVEAKTVAVNFENLTDAVTYSGLSTPFTATGDISATGDKITISADASTIGEYSQTLTIASTADSKTAEVTVKMNVVEKPAPTGTFTLHTGDLMEGDYVIVDGTNAMNNTVESNRLQYNSVTITNNEIVDPLAATIWHIAPNGEYWTVYSADADKYAASTKAKNQATLAASVSDNTKWTITKSDNTFDFENLARSKGTDPGNKYLRKNSTHGFACYASGTGTMLSLYRKAGTKYNVNISATTNGTVTADPTSAEAGTTITLTVTPAGGYVLDALTVTDASSNPVTVTDNKFTMPASDVTVTATFKENEKPAATLTLSKNGVEETFPGSWKQDDVVTLPSITSDCVKEFVGWSANASCATEPEYKAGDEYTLASTTQTLYAVYADAVGGEPTWNRVTNLAALTSGGTFILGYEATAKSGKIIPMRTSGTATTSTAGYMYSGNADGTTSNNATLDMASISESSKFEIVLEASSIVDGAVNIKLGDNYLGNEDTKNNCKLFTSASENTAFTPTIGTNDVVKLTIKANEEYTTLQFNNNSGSYRYAVYVGTQKDVVFYKKEITSSYSNYSTTCAAAPTAEVDPTSVTATAAETTGKLTVTYDNVNTEGVTVALFNDEACTEAFTADWLTASLDGVKNIIYTVAATTLYTERKAYIKLTAPEKTGATDPDVVVIPVTQAGKDKVFASLEALLEAITPTTEGVEVTVTLTNEVIQDFYTSGSYRNGIALNVPYQGGVKVIEIYCKDVPAEWVKGGKVSGTITCPWKLYNSTWELCPAAWTELTYTAPATVKSIAVSGTPTKTTYVDGEAFDPTGLVVTATLTDDSTEPIDVALVDWTFDPEFLSKGETSVSVVATYNTMESAAYEVTGLTVNEIPTKTVAEFIAAGGTRCYLEGIVSGLTEGNSMKYGNFDLTDASGTIYVYGCLNASGEKEKFAELGVKNGDKIKVIADEYELYGGTKDEAIDVQYVSHISAASITISNITMEVEEVKDIFATVEPAEAEVAYTIKENAAGAISLSGNTITALKEGTATITATVAEGATYLGNSVDFTVTVGPKSVSEDVVILAEYNGNWYALQAATGSGNNSLAALEVTYFNGTLYNVEETNKASITWTRAKVGDQVTFKNGENYLTGGSSTALTLANASFEWTYKVEDGQDTYIYEYEDNGTKARTFLFYKDGYFKNYATSNAKPTETNYSGYPVVTAPVYATGDIVYTRTVTNKYGTICLPYASASTSGATFFEVVGKEDGNKVYLASVTELEAGVPYIFEKIANTITVTCQGEAVAEAASANGLIGNFTNEYVVPANNYILYNNAFIPADGTTNKVNAYRAYLDMDAVKGGAPVQMPGRRYIGMDVQGENVETGVEDLFTTDAPVKVIENGQLIIIRGGEKFNVQGQKL